MAYEQKDNQASIFTNDKGDNANRPDFRGRGMVNGKLVWVSAWKKTTDDGKKWLSLAFQPREEQTGDGEPSTRRPNGDHTDAGW